VTRPGAAEEGREDGCLRGSRRGAAGRTLASMGTCVLSLPMRLPSLPLWSGMLVAAALIAVETLVVAGVEPPARP
jgi:hypothetical protein